MFFPVSDAASVAGQWLAAGVLTMADVFGIPWQLLAVSVIYTVIYTTANVGHGVLWLCVRLRAAAAGCEWSASSGSNNNNSVVVVVRFRLLSAGGERVWSHYVPPL